MSSNNKQDSGDTKPLPSGRTQANAATSSSSQSGTNRSTTQAGSARSPPAVPRSFSTPDPATNSLTSSPSTTRAAERHRYDPADTGLRQRRNAFSGPSGGEARGDSGADAWAQLESAKATKEAVEFVDVPLRSAEDERKEREREREEDESWEKLDKPPWLK